MSPRMWNFMSAVSALVAASAMAPGALAQCGMPNNPVKPVSWHPAIGNAHLVQVDSSLLIYILIRMSSISFGFGTLVHQCSAVLAYATRTRLARFQLMNLWNADLNGRFQTVRPWRPDQGFLASNAQDGGLRALGDTVLS